MKKIITLIYLILLCVICTYGQNFYYSPEGKTVLSVSQEKILIKFKPGTSFNAQQQILSNEGQLVKLTKDMLLPAHEITLAELQNVNSDQEIYELLGRLEQNERVIYANHFLLHEDGTLQGVMDRFILKIKQQSDLPILKEALKKHDAVIDQIDKYNSLTYYIKVDEKSSKNALEVANLMHETGYFEYSEPDFLLFLSLMNTNDPLVGSQWSLNNDGSNTSTWGGVPGMDMSVFAAWAKNTGSPNIRVAILDTGVDQGHPDLAANLDPGYDATGNGGTGGPFPGPNAHGTACAGIVAGIGNNNIGVAGVAYNCRIVPVRVFAGTAASTSTAWLADGLNWAWSTGNADILSNSWGGGSASALIQGAIDNALANGRGGLGAPVLFSAGNSNSPAAANPSAYAPTISVIAMSMCGERKSRNPTSCDGESWWGSNYGTGADIAAPGVKIHTADISGASGYNSGDYTATFNGTSSACPNAAGVMALILSQNPALTAVEARAILEGNCDKVGGYTYNTGVAGQPNDTWSTNLGYGLVNADAALSAVCADLFSIDCPTPLNVECIEDLPAADISLPVTGDNCPGPIIVTFIGDVSDGASCAEVITRTYQATDANNNSDQCEQTITVNDVTPPTIQCPGNTIIECGASEDAADTGLPVVDDNCDAPLLFEQILIPYQDANWRYQVQPLNFNCATAGEESPGFDDSSWPLGGGGFSNSSPTCGLPSQTIWPVSSNIIIRQSVFLPPGSTQMKIGIAFDNGTRAFVNGVPVNNCIYLGGCAFQDREVIDVPDNLLVIGQNTIVIVGVDGGVVSYLDARVTVRSTEPIYTDNVVTDVDCPVVRVIERTWTVYDECENMNTCTQEITIEDTTPPAISCPDLRIVDCISAFTPVATDATATDVCGTPVLSVSDAILDPGSTNNCNGATYTVTYTARDECQNATSCTQQVAIVNNGPTIWCPELTPVECESNINPVIADVTVETDCGLTSIIDISDPTILGQPGCDETVYQVTYKVIDACDREATCTRSYILENAGPELMIPPDVTLACEDDPAPAPIGDGDDDDDDDDDDDAPMTGTATASSTGGPVVIPDGTGVEVSLSANVMGVPAGATITDIRVVGLALNHTWIGDLIITLSAPNSSSIDLANRPTGNGLGLGDSSNGNVAGPINFSDGAATSADAMGISLDTDGVICVDDGICDYRPNDDSFTFADLIAALGASDPNGNWTLNISDNFGGDTGDFQGFSIEIDWITMGGGPMGGGGGPTGVATATASCDLDVNVTFEDENIVTVCDGGMILRTWTATDECGRSVSKVQKITVDPALDPVITFCPEKVIVACPEDIILTPEDVVVDYNCGVDGTVSVSGPVISVQAPGCPGAIYTYTYTVTDDCGNTAMCTQDFELDNDEDPTITVVPNLTVDCFESINPNPDWADITTACGNLVEATVSVSEPVLITDLSENCLNPVYRVTYTVLDACDRSATATQDYTIENEGPTMDCPDNCEVFGCYDGEVQAVIDAWINTVTATSSCSDELVVTNTYTDNGSVLNGICITDGITPVTFEAVDDCGRKVSCESLIIIMDDDAPQIAGTPSELLVPCTANTDEALEAWLETQGGVSAYDECSSVSWSTDPGFEEIMDQLDCESGPQAIVVEFIATDECGNSSSVTGIFSTKLLPLSVNVAGLIQTEAAEAVASVEVAAYQSNGMTAMDMSDDTGDYGFEELPFEEDTEIVPSRDNDYLNGVSTYDLIVLQQHILGINELNSPYKRIAADANRSGTISTLDLVLLRRLILHIDEELEDNTSWRFVDADFVFPNPADPFETEFPEVYNLSGEEEDWASFVAVKIGDLNLDAETNSYNTGADDRSGLEDLIFQIEDQKLQAGQEYEIEVSSANFEAIRGFQMTLEYDHSLISVLDIVGDALPEFSAANYNLAFTEQGSVPLSWNAQEGVSLDVQEAPLRVIIKAKANINLSEVLAISSSLTRAEAYSDTDLMNVALNFTNNGTSVAADEFQLFQNQPNPFKDATMIGFVLPEDSEVLFEIFDVNGRLIYSQRGDYAKGYQQIDLDRANLPNGVLYYQVSTADDSASKKMIVLE